METLEQLKEKYNKLGKERNTILKKILELEDQEIFKNFTIDNCYLDVQNNCFIKIIAINNDEFYSISIYEDSIKRAWYTIESIKDWKKITSQQFKDIYLAVLKDIQDPDLEDKSQSNWDVIFNSIT